MVQVVTVFLVNKRLEPASRYRDLAYAFQVRLTLTCEAGFVAQHDLSRIARDDWDDQLADLHYRDSAAYAAGLGCAAAHVTDADGCVRRVHTTHLPRAAVERTVAAAVPGVVFGMDALATLAREDGQALQAALTPLVTGYRDWADGQREAATAPDLANASQRARTAATLIAAQDEARTRIAAGIALLAGDAQVRLAFEIANRAVADATRARRPTDTTPAWRPFQLAFILLNLSGMADKRHPDRDIADLLFFPTGGGKTEAYLGLAAFTIALRRLGASGLLGAGVSVIMRYTLRLLTLDQLGRAAGLVCALELLRDGPEYRDEAGRPRLGDWPIEIGLWVGSDASPNKLGGKGDRTEGTAVKRVRAYTSGRDTRAPAPIKACPWCGTAFDEKSFRCVPNADTPTNLELRCSDLACPFTGDRALPVVTVDEAIYRRLPAFLIATIDKFAALPWNGPAGAFFGHVDRADETGFYGAAEPGQGRALDGGHRLDPPDLVVQDELHLISGPLGTVAGLYEAAIDRPIEIGLWVGSDASPNKLGGKGDRTEGTAVKRVRAYTSGRDTRAPAPIKACPWCGTAFDEKSFRCVPNADTPTNLELRCSDLACPFTGDRALPVVTVDEAIYRRLPAFLIATIDKFAALPWNGPAGAFFGHVDRADETGFYGAAEPGQGRALDGGHRLDPPDLVVQDELHLISGPLGTVAGLYEAAIDRLATREIAGQRVRPKIVASTATVRRASDQIRALFDRDRTRIFPPPGLDRRDSFFALTRAESEADPARWYVGLAAAGRGPKLVFLQALVTLLSAAQAMAEDGDEADAYRTALCYFNALRELGGARRIVEDEVAARLARYGAQRRRLEPPDRPFADRVLGEPVELTSRVSTDQVAAAKRRLEATFDNGEGQPVDVALATNMISVGLDIDRLGLMLVQGQPKTAAEYIQATSRVGRNPARPGLVVVVLNVHRPRDRMHFEQFGHFHDTFYRAVEATSVTPWSPRALDRTLAAVVVAIARHLDPALTPASAVDALASLPATRAAVVRHLVERAPPEVRETLAAQIEALLDDWIDIAAEQTAAGGRITYGDRPHRLLHPPLDPALDQLPPEHRRFQAGWSMRDVEPGVRIKPRGPDGERVGGAGDMA